MRVICGKDSKTQGSHGGVNSEHVENELDSVQSRVTLNSSNYSPSLYNLNFDDDEEGKQIYIGISTITIKSAELHKGSEKTRTFVQNVDSKSGDCRNSPTNHNGMTDTSIGLS